MPMLYGGMATLSALSASRNRIAPSRNRPFNRCCPPTRCWNARCRPGNARCLSGNPPRPPEKTCGDAIPRHVDPEMVCGHPEGRYGDAAAEEL